MIAPRIVAAKYVWKAVKFGGRMDFSTTARGPRMQPVPILDFHSIRKIRLFVLRACLPPVVAITSNSLSIDLSIPSIRNLSSNAMP